MKKILSLVLVLSMVLGSFGFAFAGADVKTTTVTEAGEMLKELGLLKGSNGDLMLGQNLKRQDMMVVLARLLGAEEEAEKYPLATNYPDVRGDYYKAVIGWAQAKGLTTGMGNGTFGFDGDLELRHTITFLLRALGYDSAYAWENHAKLAVDLGFVAQGANLTAVTNRGVMAQLMVNALYTPMADGEHTLGTHLGFEGFEGEVAAELEVVSVTATKANEITVVFNRAVEGNLTFDVKMGTFIVPVNAAVWNEAKTEATLVKTFGKYMAGDYTVTVNGLEEAVVLATKVEAERVESVQITSVVLVKAAATSVTVGEVTTVTDNKATANYKVLNQYGEDVTENQAIEGVSSFGTVTTNKGVATVTKAANWTATDKIGTLTLYSGIKTTTATLELVEAKKIANITLGQMVLPKDTARLASDATIEGVQIQYTAVDQYGNAVTLDTLDGITLVYGAGIVPNSARIIVKPETVNEKILVVDVDPVVAQTTATLTAIVNATGKTSTTSFVVYPAAAIADFTLTPDNKVIKAGTQYKIWIEAVDTYGSVVKATDVAAANDGTINDKFSIVTLNTGVATANANIQYDATAKKAFIAVTPNDAGKTTNLIVTLKATGKNVTLPITVNAASEIVGMTLSSRNLNFAEGGKTVLKATFIDQYGEKVETLAGYEVKVATDKAAVVEPVAVNTVAEAVAGIEVAPKAASKGQTAKLTVSLVKGATTIDAQVVNVKVIDDKTTLTYQVEDIAKLHGLGSDNAASPYAASLKLVAKDTAGNTVYVPTSVIKEVKSTNEALVKALEVTDGYKVVGLAAGVTSGTEATATLTVVVENFDGTVTVATKAVTVSNAPLAPVSLKAFVGTKEVTEVAGNFNFEVKDQYGVVLPDSYTSIVITNENGLTVTKSGTSVTVAVTNPANGGSANVTAITSNGLTLTVKVIVPAN